jgi:hypothetical protein
MAEILQRANSEWPDRTVPKDRTLRQNLQETIEEQADIVWEQCDNDFYQYPDDIVELLLDYVKLHKSEFE